MARDGQLNLIYSGKVVNLLNINNCSLGVVWIFRVLMLQINIG